MNCTTTELATFGAAPRCANIDGAAAARTAAMMAMGASFMGTL
jgi:hypothetical protein